MAHRIRGVSGLPQWILCPWHLKKSHQHRNWTWSGILCRHPMVWWLLQRSTAWNQFICAAVHQAVYFTAAQQVPFLAKFSSNSTWFHNFHSLQRTVEVFKSNQLYYIREIPQQQSYDAKDTGKESQNKKKINIRSYLKLTNYSSNPLEQFLNAIIS